MEKKTITIELTPIQLEKFELLEKNGISVGEAIEKFVDIHELILNQSSSMLDKEIIQANEKKESLEQALEKANKEIYVLNKLKDTTLNYEEKQAILENEYAHIGDDYQSKVQKIKENTKYFSFLKK